MSAYTKGPWHLHDMEANTIVGPDHLAIGTTDAISRLDETNEANARLIAAAPELLEALKAIFEDNCFYHKDGDERAYQLATEAIAKAEGKS